VILLAGCAVAIDHHAPKVATDATEPKSPDDLFNPLTPAEIENVKKRLDDLQPYTTLEECIKILGLPKRHYSTSVWAQGRGQRISMMLREQSILLIVCDGRGYVVSAQLNDKKWEWKKDEPVRKP